MLPRDPKAPWPSSSNRKHDADGNYLSGSLPDFYTYDSTRQIATVQTFANNNITRQVFDGDGRRIKTRETTHITGQTSTQVTYYVTSSVLGGRVLTELTENGGKQRTFVYAGNQVLAWQMLLLGNEYVFWEHRDPSNASFRTTNPNGSLNDQTTINGRAAELDPSGADAALADPYLISPPAEENQEALISYPSFGSAGSLGTTYSWDGIRMPADELFEMVNTLLHGRFGISQALMQGTRIIGTRTVTERWRVQPHVPQPQDDDDIVRVDTVAPYFIETSYTMPLYGTDPMGMELLTASPQNPSTIPLGDLKRNLQSLLNQGDCEKFTTAVLAEAAKQFADPGHLKHFNTVMDGYNMISAQGNYVFEQIPFDTVRGDLFNADTNVDAGPGTVLLVPNRMIRRPTPKDIAFFQADYAWTALHETLHLGKRGWYSDQQLAEAAHSVAGLAKPVWNGQGDKPSYFSDVLDQELKKHCPKPQQRK
jgi:hypothetical protein